MARTYRYFLLDVFTETALKGNQLAVFLHADGLTDGEMQALARETNLSETTFCFPGDGDMAEGIRVRIFTTQEELPFAGHPTLGTAAALRWSLRELHDAVVIRLRLKAGIVPVRFRGELTSDELPFGRSCFGEMEQPLPRFGQRHDPAAVAAALGLPLEAIDAGKPIQTVSTGLPFVIVPLVSVDALGALVTPLQAAEGYLRGTDGKFFYVLAPSETSGEAVAEEAGSWRARIPLYGGEDPATGSAAGSAAAYLVEHGFAEAGASLVIEQGVEIGRKSVLHCSAFPALRGLGSDANTQGVLKWGTGSYVRVGGSTVLVAEGQFFLS